MLTDFFFFFQAEDGIRDYKVTGVQTCALPIFWRLRRARHQGREFGRMAYHVELQERVDGSVGAALPCPLPQVRASSRLRSEERRVGKECRSRWAPYH